MATTVTRPESTESPSPGPLAENLGWLLSQTSHVLHTELTAAFERTGLAPRGYCVLEAASCGDHTQTELAQMVGLDKTTMVVTLDALEEAGLAERRPSSEDRRVREVAITAAGKRKLREAERIASKLQEDVLASLPAAERRAFVDALGRLTADRLAAPTPCSRPVRRR